jgi:hypothetical protein
MSPRGKFSIKSAATFTSKTANLKIFLLLFSYRVTRIWNRESRTFFDSNAQVRLTKGDVALGVARPLFSKRYEKSKSLFGRPNNEVRRNFTLRSCRAEDGSADKATAFHRSSLREKALPKNACRPKNSVNLCESVKSVVNFSSCLSVFVAENRSIKMSKLCETNPISQKVK